VRRTLLVAVFRNPAADLILHRKSLRRGAEKLGRQRKGVNFEGHAEVGFGFDETSHPQLGITLEAEHLNLDNVHERVEERPFGDLLVEDDHIEKSQGVHVADLGRFVAEGARLVEEIGVSDTGTLEFEDADLAEKFEGKIGPHASLVLAAERSGGREVVIALPV
jgi:hypothetical protein